MEIEASQGIVTAKEPTRLTTAQGTDGSPSVSQDGGHVAFVSERSGKREVWLLDMDSKRQRPLIESKGRPVLNAAGTRLVVGGAGVLQLLSMDGIVEKQFPGDGSTWHWAPDDSLILFNRLEMPHRSIFVLDVDSGKKTRLLADGEQSCFQGQFSPDGSWIAWMTGPSGTVWLAPFRGPQTIPQSEWIRISEDGTFADKPRWSPDGNLLYFTSDRDGFVCIYAQPLDPTTKAPRGKLLQIYHSHQARLSMGNVGMQALELGVAKYKIVFGMAELSGNVWMMERSQKD